MNETGPKAAAASHAYYSPHDRFYNNDTHPQDPLLLERQNSNTRRPPSTNPIEIQIIKDIRNPVKHSGGGAGATAFRPSWLGNVVDQVTQGREERVQVRNPGITHTYNMDTFRNVFNETPTKE